MAHMPHHHIQRAGRGLMVVARAESHPEATHAHVHLRNRLLTIFWVTIAVDVVATIALWLAERGTPVGIHGLWHSFLFCTAQLLTASSVDAPASDFGRVLELFFDLYALTVVATLAGSFGAFFHHLSQERIQKAATKAGAAAGAEAGAVAGAEVAAAVVSQTREG